jgi:ArsR family transcriptional regulator
MEAEKMDKFMVVKLLSDQNRFNIFMKLLEYDELCVCEIEDLLGIKQANTSKHLKKFKDLDIIKSRRMKNMVKYSIKEEFLNDNEALIKYLIM